MALNGVGPGASIPFIRPAGGERPPTDETRTNPFRGGDSTQVGNGTGAAGRGQATTSAAAPNPYDPAFGATLGKGIEAAPAGVDPELWSVLTAEERAFFTSARSLGPLTYGRRSTAPPPAGVARGGRIDLKV